MRRVLNKLKPVLLLLGMAFVSFGITSITNQIRGVFTPESGVQIEYKLPEVTEEIFIEESNIDSSIPTVVEEDEALVLAATTNTTGIKTCPANTLEIKSQSVCTLNESKDVDYEGGLLSGTKVSKNAQVVLSAVNIPLELYSGMEVKDSNRLISSETPTFKAAGEQIEEKTANVLLPPGTQINKHKSWVEEEPFSTKYSLAFGQKVEDPTQTGDLGVDSKLSNECEKVLPNNASNPNPDKSNKISEFMLDTTYRYPTEKESIEPEDLIEDCDETKDKFIEWPSKYEGCYMNVLSKLVAIVQTLKDAMWWNKCSEDPEDANACIYVEDIVIIMASPFGSEKDCEDGVCTNAYMATRNNSALAPSASETGKTYYTTECWAVVAGVDRQVTCAWDMSHLYKEKKVNEFDDAPTLDSTPTDEEYNKFLLEEVNGQRGTAIPL